MIAKNLEEIKNRIGAAARRAGRNPGEITLVAVAKGQPAEKILEAIEAGQRDFGENYAQELSGHVSAVGASVIHWHFIGHLQRNKVKQIIDKIALIHSVDSLELAREIDRRAAAIGRIQPILIEVNPGGEKTKTGIPPAEAESLASSIGGLDHLQLKGLMVIPPYHPDPEKARPYFRKLREIRNRINEKIPQGLTELSMGMTDDFEIAIEEGATIVRIGTGIFGERTKD